MAQAIRFHGTGGPEVLRWETVDPGDPGPGEIRVRNEAVGLNFIDTYHRGGLYPVDLPSGLGLEGAGTVTAVGADVADFTVGDAVAYGTGPLGAYAEERVMPARHALKRPDGIAADQAAAMMLQGMTVRYLLRAAYRVQAGDTVLIHAAAGGVGLIACQWARHLGATVIGTVGSPEKAELARTHGCQHTILYDDEDVAARVRELTDGAGVPVVYDGVGAATFMASLDSLRPRGILVSFGNASGPVTGVNLGILAQKGSLFVTRPVLAHYTATRAELEETAGDLFQVVGSGAVRIAVRQTYPLAEAAQAHRDLEGRKTTGSTVLLP